MVKKIFFVLLLFSLNLLGAQAFELRCLFKDKWIKARDEDDKIIYTFGNIIDGFFISQKLFSKNNENQENTRKRAKELCINSIKSKYKIYNNKLIRIAIKPLLLNGQSIDILFNKNANKKIGIDKIVVFGDSMSDDGNLFHRIKFAPAKPYFAGRFSDGPIWVDHMRIEQGIAIQNWAVGGATSRYKLRDEYKRDSIKAFLNNTIRAIFSCHVKHEINNYKNMSLLGKKIKDPESTLFILWAGGNDYLNRLISNKEVDRFLDEPEHKNGGYKEVVNKTVEYLVDDIKSILKIGAKQIAVLNLPDLGILPEVKLNQTYHKYFDEPKFKKRMGLSKKLTEVTNLHNQSLESQVLSIKKEKNDSTILFIDIFSAINSLVKEHDKLDLFWDSIHPTSQAHLLLSNFIYSELQKYFMMTGYN